MPSVCSLRIQDDELSAKITHTEALRKTCRQSSEGTSRGDMLHVFAQSGGRHLPPSPSVMKTPTWLVKAASMQLADLRHTFSPRGLPASPAPPPSHLSPRLRLHSSQSPGQLLRKPLLSPGRSPFPPLQGDSPGSQLPLGPPIPLTQRPSGQPHSLHSGVSGVQFRACLPLSPHAPPVLPPLRPHKTSPG